MHISGLQTNKNLKICQEVGCSMWLMHGLDTGLAWFKCRIEALSWQHLCKAGQAEHQACQPVVPARWQHAQLKMPTVCDMEPRCVKLSLRKKAAATATAYTIFLHSQVLYREPSVGATGSTVALEQLVSALGYKLCKASHPGGGSSITYIASTIHMYNKYSYHC